MQVEIQDVGLNSQHIKLALRNDPEFFLQFFLGDQLTHEVPQFHIDIFASMCNPLHKQIAVAIPRGFAKTTIAKLVAVWHFLFSDYRFILYVSGSHDLVVPYVNDIANFFEIENFETVFGKVEWLKRSDGEGIYKFRLPGVGNKTCVLRGLGSGQRTRGINVDNMRPELAICDDLEDDDDVQTDKQHNKMVNWWAGPFIKCLNRFNFKLILSGNLLSAKSVFYKMLSSPNWHSYLYACLKEDGTPLWPALWPMKAILADYLEYHRLGRIAQWFAEMMNHPVPAGGGLINPEKICYKPARLPEECQYGFITIDPAMSNESWADNCAVCAHGYIQMEQQWQVVETQLEKGMNPTQIFQKATDMATKWHFKLIGCESGAMQGGLLHTFELLKIMLRMPQFEFVPVMHNNVSKPVRIIAWASLLEEEPATPTDPGKQALYALTFGEFVLTSQIVMYDPQKKENDDDGIDCAAQGLQMQQQHMEKIISQMPAMPNKHNESIYAIADC